MPNDADAEWRGMLKERLSSHKETLAKVEDRVLALERRQDQTEKRIWMATGAIGLLCALSWIPSVMRLLTP
jgi:hypothetical protein